MNDNDVEKTKTNFISSTGHVSETLCLPLIPTTAVLNPVPWSQHVKSLIPLITGRNEVVAKVMFLHVSVIMSTGGFSRQGEPPPGRENPPPGWENLPGWENPPGSRLQNYGLRAAGTHPTGMHSCFSAAFIQNKHNAFIN